MPARAAGDLPVAGLAGVGGPGGAAELTTAFWEQLAEEIYRRTASRNGLWLLLRQLPGKYLTGELLAAGWPTFFLEQRVQRTFTRGNASYCLRTMTAANWTFSASASELMCSTPQQD